MLAVTCPECNTILLQDKQGSHYCIACQELDTDTCKDDPVLSSSAAETQRRERTLQDTENADDMPYMRREPAPIIIPQSTGSHPQSVSQVTSSSQKDGSSMQFVTSTVPKVASGAMNLNLNFADTVDILVQKIQWASQELCQCNSVEYSSVLCLMIKNAADAIQSLKLAS